MSIGNRGGPIRKKKGRGKKDGAQADGEGGASVMRDILGGTVLHRRHPGVREVLVVHMKEECQTVV